MTREGRRNETEIRERDRAASGAPSAGWALRDRFSWEEIHQRVLAAADEEVAHRPRELFFSGVTAGFAIVLTVIGHSVGRAELGGNLFLSALLYPIGFLYIILGRYQLYTENTLPPVALVLTRMASLPLLLRVWGIALAANVAGAAVGTLIIARTHVLSDAAMTAAASFVYRALTLGWWDIFFRALFAGWLVAGVIWLNSAARDTISRVAIIYFVFFVIGAAELFHVVTAASEMFFVLFSGAASPGFGALLWRFWLPVLFGNTAGGVLAFTGMAYAQAEQRRFPEIRVLTLRELLFAVKGGRPFGTPRLRPSWSDVDAPGRDQQRSPAEE